MLNFGVMSNSSQRPAHNTDTNKYELSNRCYGSFRDILRVSIDLAVAQCLVIKEAAPSGAKSYSRHTGRLHVWLDNAEWRGDNWSLISARYFSLVSRKKLSQCDSDTLDHLPLSQTVTLYQTTPPHSTYFMDGPSSHNMPEFIQTLSLSSEM